MSEDEYIDMMFDGDVILFEQAEQQHMASEEKAGSIAPNNKEKTW